MERQRNRLARLSQAGDPFILGSFVALAATLVAPLAGRGAKVALGVVAGCALFLALSGATYLAAEITDDQTGSWVGSLAVGLGTTGFALVVAKLDLRFGRRVSRPGAVLVFVGALLLVAAGSVTYDGVSFTLVSKGTALLTPLLAVALAWLALAAGATTTRMFFGAVAGAVLLLNALSEWPALTTDLHAAFALAEAGYAVVLVGVAFGVRRTAHSAGGDPTLASPPLTEAPVTWPALIVAVGLAACAMLLLYLNGNALNERQPLWYD